MPILDIKELMDVQIQLQADMGDPLGQGELGVKENMLALIVEATEVLDEINWKPWKQHPYKEVNREALKTEFTDILQFWANAVTSMGFTPEELSEALRDKWDVNYKRIEDGLVKSK